VAAPSIRPAAPREGECLREITMGAKGFWGYDPARAREWTASLDLSEARLRTAHACAQRRLTR